MPCSHPITGWKTQNGTLTTRFRPGTGLGGSISVPCGRCTRCRLEHSRQWAVRCMHELQMHDQSAFINLTYSQENYTPTLVHRHFQLFMKRLRERRHKKLSYYMSGEYGEQTLRPHYHAILFGTSFADRVYHSKSPSGFDLYRSDELDEIWGLGHATIGEVTFESAAYVARYVMKKQTAKGAPEGYDRINLETGETISVVAEYARMSRNPAIGKRWIEKNNAEVYPNDYVVSRAAQAKPPRYYDKYLKNTQPELAEAVALRRKTEALSRMKDNTPERLKVKEAVAIARLNLKKRTLE